MTRFEYASQTSEKMALMAAYCVVTYLEAINYHKFNIEEMKEFLEVASNDLQKWLEEEQK